jgi:hypothetical protein
MHQTLLTRRATPTEILPFHSFVLIPLFLIGLLRGGLLADIYSFGVIMWEVWTGAEPWEGLPIHALIHRMTSPQGLTLPVPGEPSWRDGEDTPAAAAGGDADGAAAGGGQATPAGPPEPAPGYKALMLSCRRPAELRPSSGQLLEGLEAMMAALRRQQQQGQKRQQQPQL